MRQTLSIIIICLFSSLLLGCKKTQLRIQLKDLMNNTVILPERINCVYEGEIYTMPESLYNKPKLVVYIDSTECTTCRISHLWEYLQINELSEQSGKFTTMILLSNKSFGPISLERYLSDQELPIPVYIDLDNLFLARNNFLKEREEFHSVFIGVDGRPLFIGDPTLSGEMLSAFKYFLDKQP